jgi:hypothetical protein
MDAFLSNSQQLSANAEPKRKAKYYTKVVTQFTQFLSDSRAGNSLIDQGNLIDEEELEPTANS